MKKKIEILSPCGSSESVKPAVNMGANAIYLGLQTFSARSKAKNFDKKELLECVEYCHVRNVKVYLAVNTLIKSSEIPEVLEIIKYACEIAIDAVIVQDIGLLYLLRKIVPDLPIHASTQMSCHTVAGAKLLKDIGIKRVVLARELAKEDIKKIVESCDIETEVFVHGALCVSFSGQCYMSAIFGTRSANRGLCAGSCRLPFCINGTKKDYVLSLKDNSIVDKIKELEEIGVTSAKIEGRMKRPEYVAISTKACYDCLNSGNIAEDLQNKLRSVFSRDGFTCAYYNNNINIDIYGNRKKEDVLSADKKTLQNIRQMYRIEKQFIGVNFNLTLSQTSIELKAKDTDGFEAYATLPRDENIGFPCNEQHIVNQLSKTGNTPFYANKIYLDLKDNVFIKMAEINYIRRFVLTKLEKERKKRNIVNFNDDLKIKLLTDSQPKNISKKIKIRAWFEDTEIPSCFKDCELVYIPLFTDNEKIVKLISEGFKVAVHMPVIITEEEKISGKLEECQKLGVNDVWVGTLDSLQIAKKYNMKIHAGFRMNVFNNFACDFLKDCNVADTELSVELKAGQISAIAKRSKISTGIIGYGYLPIMLLRNCPIKYTEKGCANTVCKEPFITDRKNIYFRVLCNQHYVEILNFIPLYIGDKIDDFEGVDFIVLRYNVENFVEKEENYISFNSRTGQKMAKTRGLYYRGVE